MFCAIHCFAFLNSFLQQCRTSATSLLSLKVAGKAKKVCEILVMYKKPQQKIQKTQLFVP